MVAGVGDTVDVLVHTMEGWASEMRRVAAEFVDGVQLDLVVMPAGHMSGLRDREVAIVDKDGDLAGAATSQLFGPPHEKVAREWAMAAWWWVSDIAKYLERGSQFEAAERIALVRNEALKLFAAAHGIPYPSFGLTSLLDHEPLELPPRLADTYPQPVEEGSIGKAAQNVAALLDECAGLAADRLGHDLATGWRASALDRLGAALD